VGGVLEKILTSVDIPFSEVTALTELFKSDSARRYFVKVLKKTMKRTPTLQVSENSFKLLLYLFSTCLGQQDLSESKDFRACRILMFTSCALSRKLPNGTSDFIQTHITGYEIWSDVAFWEEYFWDEVSQKYKAQFGDAEIAPDAQAKVTTAFNQSYVPIIGSSFLHDMILSWKLSAQTAMEFALSISAQGQLSPRQVQALKQDINLYLEALESDAKRKEVEENLKNRFRKTRRQSGIGAAVLMASVGSGASAEMQLALMEEELRVKEEEKRERRATLSLAPTDPSESEHWISSSKKWNRRSRVMSIAPTAPPPELSRSSLQAQTRQRRQTMLMNVKTRFSEQPVSSVYSAPLSAPAVSTASRKPLTGEEPAAPPMCVPPASAFLTMEP
jgi:hypothetical protein